MMAGDIVMGGSSLIIIDRVVIHPFASWIKILLFPDMYSQEETMTLL